MCEAGKQGNRVLRVIESSDGILDPLCTQGQSTVRQLGRASHAFEF